MHLPQSRRTPVLRVALMREVYALTMCNVRAAQRINLNAIIDLVIPAQAGIQWHAVENCRFHWTPACAGVTEDEDK